MIDYAGMHYKIVMSKGSASRYPCNLCKATNAEEWAYDLKDLDELTDTKRKNPRKFSKDINHYIPLCRSCHKKHDKFSQGEKNGRSILTESDVRTIKELLNLGEWNQRRIAREFGVHFSAISDINTGKKWKHIQ